MIPTRIYLHMRLNHKFAKKSMTGICAATRYKRIAIKSAVPFPYKTVKELSP